MPMFWGDYLSVSGALTTEESGACLHLMGHYWYGKMLGIPDDDRILARITKLPLRRWKAIKPAVMGLFVARDGAWYFRFPAVWREALRPYIGVEIRRAVLKRDGHVCQYCGDTDGPFEFDHYIPFSRGGQTTVENLRIACATCNRDKWDVMPEDWLAVRKDGDI